MNRLKYQLFLDLKDRLGHKSQDWRERQIQGVTEQRLRAENAVESSAKVEKPGL